MPEPGDVDIKRMRLRYAGVCRICATELPTRTEATYERATKTVSCVEHGVADLAGSAEPDAPPSCRVDWVGPGTPGASARREFERRRTAHEVRIRRKHPAIGEERLGSRLNELAGDTLRVLHDRRIPKSRANLDHVAISESGVFVIDAKRYKGRPHLEVEGGILRPRVEKLMVGRRDRSSLVDGVLKQVQVVPDIVGSEVPVKASCVSSRPTGP